MIEALITLSLRVLVKKLEKKLIRGKSESNFLFIDWLAWAYHWKVGEDSWVGGKEGGGTHLTRQKES